MNLNRYLKIILGLLGTIVVGAIGSGLWERVLSHWFDALVKGAVNLMSTLIKTYKDSIYLDASDGFHEYSAMYVHVVLLMILPAIYYFALLRHPYVKTKRDNKFRDFLRSKNGYYTLVFLTLSIAVSFVLASFKVMYTNRVVTHAMKSIDIVSPFLTETEHKKLIAQFRQMSSETDYNDFRKHIEELATTNSVILPKIK